MCLAPAAAMEVEVRELREADVLWPEPDNDDDHHHHQDHCHCHGRRRQLEARDKHNKQLQGAGGEAPPLRGGEARRRAGSSAPVGIRPGNATGPSSWAGSYYDDSDEPAAAFVPPHLELAARRRCSESEGRVASSVCVGRGRTLKGRDLQSVRTAVLRMTEFLEN